MKKRIEKTFFQPPFEAYRETEPYIFVSYSRKDINSVYPEILKLHLKGYRIWYDDGLEPGRGYTTQLSDKVKNCSLI